MANILIIDDDDQLLDMVAMVLRRNGHDITLFNEPHQGLERVLSHPPDLLILDVMMPGLNGHDLCRQIRTKPALAKLPIIILSARTQDIDRKAAFDVGADAFVPKPVSAPELITQVDAILGSKANSKRAPRKGIIISVFGLRGGVGRTTIAVNLALALRWLSQRDVCLVDLSPSSGQVTTHLRQPAKDSWMDLPPPSKLNVAALRRSLVTHSSGLHILAGPSLPMQPSQPTEALATALFETLHNDMLFSILDLPAVLNPATQTALRHSDLILHVVAPEFVSIRVAAKSNRVLEGTDYSGVQKVHVLNQPMQEAQLPSKAVERGLGARVAFQIGYDAHQPRALTKGLPLPIDPATSPVPIGVRTIADALWQRIRSANVSK